MAEIAVVEKPKPFYNQMEAGMDVKQWVFLLYGQSGVQKTRLAAQFPDPIFISCERGDYGGLLSAREFNPKYIAIKDYNAAVNLLPQLRTGAGKEFKTVVLDSATAFQKIAMNHIIKLSGRELPLFQDWGLCLERVRTFIEAIKNMGVHVVIIALENITKDEISGKVMGGPNVPGKFASELPAGVDICIHMMTRTRLSTNGKKEKQFVMTATGDDTWVAKDCSGTLPVEMISTEQESTFKHLAHLFAGNNK